MERLSQLLSDELEIYGQIRKLTENQVELLDKDEFEEFDSSLEKREGLIGKIKGLHQEKETLMQSYVSFSKSNENKHTTEKIENLKEQIQETLQICSDLNNKNIAVMEKKTKEQTHKIDEHSAKRKGIGGYAQAVVNTPEMFDKKT
jgi:flagellar biosynthesis/type III secretory pathway chaperone